MEMTDEVKDLGISRELWNQWVSLMDALWKEFQHKGAENKSNSIYYRKWVIDCKFVNGDYLEMNVSVDEVVILSLRHESNLKSTAIAILAVAE